MDKYELVILGGGITGSFAGFIAGKLGIKTVIIESNDKPDGATARSGGIITRMLDNDEDAMLALKSINLINEIFKNDKEIIHRGYLCIEDAEEAEYDIKRFKKFIPEIRMLYPSDISNNWDYIKIYDGEVGLYAKYDMTVEPINLLYKLWNKVCDLGVELLLGNRADRIIIKNTSVNGVELANGKILFSDNVLVTLGAWTKQFMRKHGIKIKTFLLSVPIFRFKIGYDNVIIGLWDEKSYSYWRPSVNNTLVGGGYDAYRITDPSEGFISPTTESRAFIKKLFNFRYKFNNWKIIDSWCGPISISYSYHPIAMKVNKVDGLYVIDGLGGYGLMRGPALAKMIVEQIV